MNIIKEFTFTSLLGLFGFFVGLLFLSTLDFSISTNYGLDPVNSFTSYFKESFGMIIKGAGLGIAVGITLGFAGLIIDFLRQKPDLDASKPVSV